MDYLEEGVEKLSKLYKKKKKKTTISLLLPYSLSCTKSRRYPTFYLLFFHLGKSSQRLPCDQQEIHMPAVDGGSIPGFGKIPPAMQQPSLCPAADSSQPRAHVNCNFSQELHEPRTTNSHALKNTCSVTRGKKKKNSVQQHLHGQ